MFTGIVQELGSVNALLKNESGFTLEVGVNEGFSDGLLIGASIAVNGCCLTVTEFDQNSISFDVIKETIRVTNLEYLGLADKVNLERSLKYGDEVGGHILSGHVSCGAEAILKKQEGEFLELAGNYGFSYDQRDRAFMPTSGSIVRFNQVLPIVADKPFIGNTISSSSYNTISENIVGAAKFYVTAINGLDDENVRLSKRKLLSSSRLRGFEKGKIGPVDSNDHIGGNYAAAFNLEANLPNLLPESTNTDISVFFDAGNVWGVDYDETIDDSNKLRSSSGVAASWISPLGPMTFIFAQNLSKATTDKTEFFNFNLGTSF